MIRSRDKEVVFAQIKSRADTLVDVDIVIGPVAAGGERVNNSFKCFSIVGVKFVRQWVEVSTAQENHVGGGLNRASTFVTFIVPFYVIRNVNFLLLARNADLINFTAIQRTAAGERYLHVA